MPLRQLVSTRCTPCFSIFLSAVNAFFFSTFFFPALAFAAAGGAALRRAARMSSSVRWEYQMSMTPICANSAMASRYARTTASVAARASALLKPLLRAAIVKLAARRSTSYSNGPGSVSSKSLRSKRSSRSGDANAPKFERCASPQSCTVSPARGVSLRSAAMILAAPR